MNKFFSKCIFELDKLIKFFSSIVPKLDLKQLHTNNPGPFLESTEKAFLVLNIIITVSMHPLHLHWDCFKYDICSVQCTKVV